MIVDTANGRAQRRCVSSEIFPRFLLNTGFLPASSQQSIETGQPGTSLRRAGCLLPRRAAHSRRHASQVQRRRIQFYAVPWTAFSVSDECYFFEGGSPVRSNVMLALLKVGTGAPILMLLGEEDDNLPVAKVDGYLIRPEARPRLST